MIAGLLLATQIVLTSGGSLFQPGQVLGGTFAVKDCSGCEVRFYIANHTPGFPAQCFDSNFIAWSYLDDNGIFVHGDALDLTGCNSFISYDYRNGSMYDWQSWFTGVDSEGRAYTATMTGQDRYYRVCTRTCAMKLTTTGFTLVFEYPEAVQP